MVDLQNLARRMRLRIVELWIEDPNRTTESIQEILYAETGFKPSAAVVDVHFKPSGMGGGEGPPIGE